MCDGDGIGGRGGCAVEECFFGVLGDCLASSDFPFVLK